MLLVALDMSNTQLRNMSTKILLKGILIITVAKRNEHVSAFAAQPLKHFGFGKSPVSTMF